MRSQPKSRNDNCFNNLASIVMLDYVVSSKAIVERHSLA